MTNINIDTDKEFSARIIAALTFYGLEAGDLGKLTGVSATAINDITENKRSLGLKRADKIAQVFGLRYFELANSKLKFKAIRQLPVRTQKVIQERKEKGPSNHERNTDLDLPKNTLEVLSKLPATAEFTANEIYDLLPTEIKSLITPNRVTTLFKKGSLKKYVVYADRKLKHRHMYKFISENSIDEIIATLKEL